MLRIGLTGGIGSGKSSVSRIFIELGAPVIDSDQIAHQLVRPGSPALEQLTQIFGKEVLLNDGSLNRQHLRNIVFSDAAKRQALESLLHPLIRQEIDRQVEQLSAPYVIIAIPLLLEKGWQHQLDRVLVVDCDERQQFERAHKRDGSSRETIEAIMDSQVGRATRLAAADDTIDNSHSTDYLRPQVEALHQQYLAMAASD